MRSVERDFMETSCGVVLVNFGAILLLQYPQGHWDLPKGHVEADDDNRQATMLRELAEETGITDVTVLEGFVERSEYSFRHKGNARKRKCTGTSQKRNRCTWSCPTNTEGTYGWTGTEPWKPSRTMKPETWFALLNST